MAGFFLSLLGYRTGGVGYRQKLREVHRDFTACSQPANVSHGERVRRMGPDSAFQPGAHRHHRERGPRPLFDQSGLARSRRARRRRLRCLRAESGGRAFGRGQPGARVSQLSRPARHERSGRGDHRHARALASPHAARRTRSRQRCLRGKAAMPDAAARRGTGARRRAIQKHRASGNAAAQLRPVSARRAA